MNKRVLRFSFKMLDFDEKVKTHLLGMGKYIPEDKPYEASISDVKLWLSDKGLNVDDLNGLSIEWFVN